MTFAVLVAAVALFAVAAVAAVGGTRLGRDHPAGPAVLLGLGLVTAAAVVLLWLDGRVQRYFDGTYWAVVLLAPVAGASAAGSRRGATAATIGLIGAFAIAFATRLPTDGTVGSAAAIGLHVESVVVACYCLPGMLLGAAGGELARKHLSLGSSR